MQLLIFHAGIFSLGIPVYQSLYTQANTPGSLSPEYKYTEMNGTVTAGTA